MYIVFDKQIDRREGEGERRGREKGRKRKREDISPKQVSKKAGS